MIWAALLIFGAEVIAMKALEEKYRREGEDDISFEEFVARASFDDVLRMRYHSISMWIAMGVTTMAAGLGVLR